MNDVDNIVSLKNHADPHPQKYYDYIYKELQQAVSLYDPHTPEYTDTVRLTLRKLGE